MVTNQDLFKQYCIAITGSIASGKSTVCSMLTKLGYRVIDADNLARLAVAPGSEGLRQIKMHFGDQVIAKNGSLDRAMMRQVVFKDPKAREKLEQIIHPYLEHLAIDKLKQNGFIANPRIWFYEASLIYEKSLQDRFKSVWVCYCDEETQIQRLLQRDHLSLDQAHRILNSQLPGRDKAMLADYVIDTECELDELQKRVIAALEIMKKD